MNVCRSYESSLHSNDHPGENSKGGSWPAIWAIAPNIHCRPTDTNNRGVRRVVFPCHYVNKWLWYGFAWRIRLWVGVVHDHMITCMWMNGDWSRWLLQCGLFINCLLTQLHAMKIATSNLQIVCRLQIKNMYLCWPHTFASAKTQINVHGLFNNKSMNDTNGFSSITFKCYLMTINRYLSNSILL